jgi:hypothetical protein
MPPFEESARWVALIVRFCATAPCERAYAMNDLPGSSQPKFVQDAVAHWWSPTAPDGEEFELPSGTKTCSRLKVRFVGKITMVAARVGPTYPWGVSFLVEDNFGDQQYRSGKVIKSRFLPSIQRHSFWPFRNTNKQKTGPSRLLVSGSQRRKSCSSAACWCKCARDSRRICLCLQRR